MVLNPEESVRTFIAAEPPFAVRAAFGARIDAFKKQGADVKWTETPDLHLTLRFLGEIPAGRVPAALDAVRGACSGFMPFEARFEAGGAFPDWGRPAVFWAGIGEGAGSFVDLAARLETAFASAGWPAESRPFVPHLTLGRVRSGRGLEALGRRLQTASFRDIPPFTVSSVVLFRSRPSAAGSKYDRLGEIRLI